MLIKTSKNSIQNWAKDKKLQKKCKSLLYIKKIFNFTHNRNAN